MPVYQNAVCDNLQIGEVGILFDNERIAATTASKAFSLQRDKVPYGAAFQITFSADPGSFEVEIQGSETNDTKSFVKLASVTAANSTFVARYDMVAFFAKYVRIYIKTLANGVYISAIVTR